MKYPIYIPDISGNEKEYVYDCLDSTWISSLGKYIDKFEEMMCVYTGVKYAVSVHNGTEAIHLALLTLDLKPGDEIIVPDFTFIATANAVKYIGATPVLVDVDPYTWNIKAEDIEKSITNKTKAIIVVHIYGCPVEIEPILKLAKKHNLFVIEDAAEAIGAEYKNKKAGNLADIATLSFFGNKTITTGEGGMVLLNDPIYAKKARQIKGQGVSPSQRYYHPVLGYNFRMTNIQAAIGCAQMERIESILKKKIHIYNYYKSKLEGRVKFQLIPDHIKSSYWMISFELENKIIKEKLSIHLENNGIETRPFFYPVHEMPYFESVNNTVTKSLSENGLTVPSYPLLSEEDIDYITGKILEIV